MHPYHSSYQQLAQKSGPLATVLYPMLRSSNNIREGRQQEQAVGIRQPEDQSQVIKIEQQRQRLNREITDIEQGRGSANKYTVQYSVQPYCNVQYKGCNVQYI